jgi:hypothetical protein
MRDKGCQFAELEEPTMLNKSNKSCCYLENLVTFPQAELTLPAKHSPKNIGLAG